MPKESKEFKLTPKFKLIVDHLKAVRTLAEYVNGAGLKKDIQDLANYLQRDLSAGVLRPAGWEDLYRWEGCLYSSPLGINTLNALLPKWSVVEDNVIAIEIVLNGPIVADEEPYVSLYVPETWERRQQFMAKLEPPPGFEHVSQHPEGALLESLG